jgi:type III restriction enzyme
MLPSAARQSKETLRMFRDSGRFATFFPPEDDAGLNKVLLEAVPNLDTNDIAELGYADGRISFRLMSSNDPELNWKLAQTLVVDVSDEDRELLRKNGEPFDRSLFEKVYQRDFNTLEKDTAWYLDGKDCVFWWHRIAVHQSSYGLQGWQRNRVYPDFLACIHGVEKGKFRFSVLETKGDHLKGNDDTEYKQKLFDLLTAHASTAIRAGDLRLGVESEQMNFTMLLEDSWREKLENAVR